MKVKNENISNIINGLEMIGKLDIDDYKFNYTIGRNLEKLVPMLKSYNKSFEALINKYTLKDNKGKPVIVNKQVQIDDKGKPIFGGGEYDYNSKEDRENYIKKKTELQEMENEVDLWKLKTSILEKIKGVNGVMNFMLKQIIIDDKNIFNEKQDNSTPQK